jgi:hypothetical protein
MKKGLCGSFALIALCTTQRVHAEGEAQSPQPQQPPPQQPQQPQQPQGDAWDNAMKQGMHQEGRMSQQQLAQKERSENEEIENAEAVRKSLRFGVFASGGGGINPIKYNLTSGLTNREPMAFRSAGGEFQIGAGIRKGISLEWDFQGRLLFMFMQSDPRSGGFVPDEVDPGLGASIDGTARYHFGGTTKPWYFGFGARCDVLSVSGTARSNTPASGTVTKGTVVAVAPLAVAEIGIVLMDAQRFDLSLRIAGGLGFHIAPNVGVAF